MKRLLKMKRWPIFRVTVVLLALLYCGSARSQREIPEIPDLDIEDVLDDTFYEELDPVIYVSSRPEQGERSADWKAATEDVDFSSDIKRKKAKEKSKPDAGDGDGGGMYSPASWKFLSDLFSGLGTFVQVLIIVVLVGAIAFALYYLLRMPRNRQISKSGVEITWENLDQFLDETELEHFLKEALQKKTWPQAIRVYFLMCIQYLSRNGSISWAKHKTNRNYQMEMRENPLFEPFREATRVYEKVWYGEQAVDEQEFKRLEPVFTKILKKTGSEGSPAAGA